MFALATSIAAAANAGGKNNFQQSVQIAIDASARMIASDLNSKNRIEKDVGLDTRTIIAGPFGDLAVLTLQGYFTQKDLFEGNLNATQADEWDFVFRIFRADMKLFKRIGAPRLRIGHVELPFGLEQPINTNGTLRQFGNRKNLGLKTDWGIGLIGETQKFEYELLLSNGTGQDLSRHGSPWAFTGRLGSNESSFFRYGISFHTSQIGAISRLKIGYDHRLHFGPFSTLGEISIGETAAKSEWSGLLEIDWTTPDETLIAYAQTRLDDENNLRESTVDWTVAIGARYAPNSHWALSLQYSITDSYSAATPPNNSLSFQIRHRL